MKGIISSLVVLVAFLSALLVVIAFVADIQNNYDVVNSNAVGDRVFYKFSAIENSIIRIAQVDLAKNSFNVSLKEGASNFVTFNVSFPSTMGNFSQDMRNLETFAETRLNETNMAVDLNLTNTRNCLPLTIMPYNISFGTFNQSFGSCGFGANQKDLKLTPNGNASNYVSGYDMLIGANKTKIDISSASWTPVGDCTGSTLNWTIKILGNNTAYGPVTQMVKPNGKCVFKISELGTAKNIIFINNTPGASDPNKTLTVSAQSGFNITFTVTLNLTDVPGKLKVVLPPQSIKVRENLFLIERNDTAAIQ